MTAVFLLPLLALAAGADDPPQDQTLGSSPDDKQFTILVTGEDNAPIAGARLWLELDHPAYPRCVEPDQRRMAVIHTKADGRAKLYYPAKPTAIVVTAKGFAPQLLRDVDLTKQDPYPVRLAHGQTIRGHVVGVDGAPAANVEVTATPKAPVLEWFDEFKLAGRTDADGRFQLPHAGEGPYQVGARIESKDAAPAHVEPVMLNVAAGAAPEPLELIAKAAGTVHGVIISAHEVPVGGREVSTWVRLPKASQWATKTEPDGSFAIHGIPPKARGGIAVWAPRGYFARIDLPPDQPFLRMQGTQIQFDSVPPGRHDGLTVRFLKEAVVSGVVKDDAGQPVEGVYVKVNPTDYLFKTDASGKYEARIPPLEDITLEISGEGKAEGLSKPTVRAKEDEKLERDFVVKRIVHPAHDEEIVGRVVDAAGKGVGGAKVYFGNYGLIPKELEDRRNQRAGPGQKAPEGPVPTWSGGMFYPTALTTDEQGNFTFNLLYAGTTDLWAESDTGDIGWAPAVKTGSKDVTIRIAPRSDELTVAGNLFDADGRPVGGARVFLFNGDHNSPALLAESKTTADGTFSFRTTPPWQQFRYLRLICSADAHPIAWRLLPQCSVDGVTIKLKQPAVLAGRAVDSRGKGVGGGKASLYLADDPDYGRMFFFRAGEVAAPTADIGKDGTFELGRLPRGCTASIKVRHPEHGTGESWYAKDLDARRDIGDVKLPDGITLEGVVRHANGAPAAGARVTVGKYGEESDPSTTTNIAGRFKFVGLESWAFHDEYTTVCATLGDREEPQSEGEARLEARLYPGDAFAGIEVTLERSFAAVQAEWRQAKATGAPTKFRVAVLDDADPAFGGKARYDDTLTLYDGEGTALWQHKGFNISQTVGGNHAVAYSPPDRSLWVVENTGNRLLRFDTDGKLLWEKPGVKGHAVAVDPATGNGWVLTEEGTIYGKTLVVFSPAGEKIAEHKVAGFDIVHSPKDDCFWAVGQKLTKLDRGGKVLFETPQPFAWIAASVSVDDTDGTVWVMERAHPQVGGSTGRVIAFAADGRRLAESPAEGGCVATDGARKIIWAGGMNLQRLTPDARPAGAPVPFRAFHLAVEPDTGCAWAAGNEGVARLDPSGEPVWEKRTRGGSQKWLCVVPP